jgi:hypothetical protein
MRFRSPLWYPAAFVASVVNIAGAGFAVGLGEPGHTAVHVGLAALFGFVAHRLRPARADTAGDDAGRLEALEDEMLAQRRELAEAQERLDFAERLLAQSAEQRRVGVEREGPGSPP